MHSYVPLLLRDDRQTLASLKDFEATKMVLAAFSNDCRNVGGWDATTDLHLNHQNNLKTMQSHLKHKLKKVGVEPETRTYNGEFEMQWCALKRTSLDSQVINGLCSKNRSLLKEMQSTQKRKFRRQNQVWLILIESTFVLINRLCCRNRYRAAVRSFDQLVPSLPITHSSHSQKCKFENQLFCSSCSVDVLLPDVLEFAHSITSSTFDFGGCVLKALVVPERWHFAFVDLHA